MYKTILALAICALAVAAGAEENPQPLSPGFSPALAMFHADDKSLTPGNPSYLGVYIRDVRPDRMSELKLKDQHGAEITMVDRDGPAGKAGLKEDDVILSFNGKPVSDADDLRRMIQSTPAGTSVSLGISRDGQPISFNLQLGDRNEALSKRAAKIHIPAMEIPGFSIVEHSRRYGLVVETLSRQLAQYFGAKNGQGILVRSVDKGSPAESAGFNAGDVILRVGDEAIDDVGDWGRILHHSAGQTVAVSILRNHKEHSITFPVPNRRGNGGSAGLEFLLPSIDDLQDYFDGFGKNVQQQVYEAMRSKQMQEFWKQQQGNVDQLQRDLARMGPKVDRALQQMQDQMRKAFQEHQQEFGGVY